MPKNINTPRDELICGKLDAAWLMAKSHGDAKLCNLLSDIQHDAERMESKLLIRKDEVFALQSALDTQKPAGDAIKVVAKICSDKSNFLREQGFLTEANTIDTALRSIKAALNGDCGGGDVDWSGLDKILRGMRARNEQGSLELTNWIADNKALTADNAKRGSDDSKA